MIKQLAEFFSSLEKSDRVRLAKMQILIVISSLMEAASVLAVGPFMALISSPESTFENQLTISIASFFGIQTPNSFLIFIGILILILMSISSIFSVLTTWRLAIFGGDIGSKLSNKLFAYYIKQPLTFHIHKNTNELSSKLIMECNRMTNAIILQLLQLNSKLALILMLISIILFTVPGIAIAATLFFVGSYALLYKFARLRLVRNGLVTSIEQQERMKLINESFGGIKEVMLNGLQDRLSKKYADSTISYFKAWSSTQVLSQLPKYAMELAAFGTIILAIIVLLINNDNDLTKVLPIIAIFGMASLKLLPAFQQIYFSISTITSNTNAFLIVRNELIEIKEQEILKRDSYQNLASEPLSFESSIEFKNISFHYDKNTSNVLNDVSFLIKAKESTGIVGPSGSGKSTAVNILVGLLPPSMGSLLIDGRELDEAQVHSWQHKIGFVSQDIFLIDASIKENIAFGQLEGEVDGKKLNQAIRMAQLEELISSMPEGLETTVGERGVQLSGGQLQRIGIARALYHDPEVIIFDEATSNLDRISEKAIMETIKLLAASKTIIMIAHRLSTVQDCDNIFLFSEGKIEDSGTYEQLFKSSAKFVDLS
jgi:ATP-binding cassette, subfamily B, bacterial PglK